MTLDQRPASGRTDAGRAGSARLEPDQRQTDGGDHGIDKRDLAQRTLVGAVAVVISMLAIGVVGRLTVFGGAPPERDLMEWIADNRVGILDTIATQGSAVSDTWTVIGVLFGAVMMLLATRHVRCAALLLIGISIELTTFLVVGTLIGRPRPDVEALHTIPSTASFPSGHVAGAFVLYGSLTLVARAIAPAGRVPRATWLAPIAVASVVAWSRVYEGVHYPTDVVAGFLLGLGALAAAAYATRFVEPRSRVEE